MASSPALYSKSFRPQALHTDIAGARAVPPHGLRSRDLRVQVAPSQLVQALRFEAERSQALRSQVEAALASRFAGALSPAPRTIREVAATGIAEIDALLSGGLPVGAISELVGPECSGRMSAALSFVAQRSGEGRVCAWVDVSDAFDPESAAANGVGLSQLLWVRCADAAPQVRPSAAQDGAQVKRKARDQTGTLDECASISAFSLEPKTVTRIQHGCGGQHPRGEIRGMDAAVEDLLREQPHRAGNRTATFTPGAPNRKLETRKSETQSIEDGRQQPEWQKTSKQETKPLGAVVRNEQVSTDRQPKPGRSKYIVEHQAADCESFCACCAEATHKPRHDKKIIEPRAGAFDRKPPFARAKETRPWTRLDQALRATDLLLQAGGFSAIVLDLGSIGPEHATRIPLATWFRFRQAADHSRTSLVVLAQTSCVKSSAAMVLRFEGMAVLGSTVMEGARFEVGASRQRFAPSTPSFVDAGNARKPPLATWQSAMYSPAGDRGVKRVARSGTTERETVRRVGPESVRLVGQARKGKTKGAVP